MSAGTIKNNPECVDYIKQSLEELNRLEIKHEYKQQCAKYYAIIDLTNGKKIMFCCFTRTFLYKNRTYNKKNKSVAGLVRFMEVNNLEVVK